jgi:acetamidase/formamidase
VQEVGNFLVADKGMAPGDAYALASIACDFRVAEAVNLTQLVVRTRLRSQGAHAKQPWTAAR